MAASINDPVIYRVIDLSSVDLDMDSLNQILALEVRSRSESKHRFRSVFVGKHVSELRANIAHRNLGDILLFRDVTETYTFIDEKLKS